MKVYSKKNKSAFLCKEESRSEKLQWQCESKAQLDQKIILRSVEFINVLKQLNVGNTALEAQIKRELAANRLEDSLQWIKQELNANPKAQDTLHFAVLLAKSQGAKELARNWHRQLVSLNPKDAGLLRQQIELEMAIPDLAQALDYAKQWVALAPDDLQAHQKYAELAQWASKADITLNEWLWLYHKTKHADLLSKLIKLAMDTQQYAPLITLLAEIGHERPLTESEVTNWFDAILLSGAVDSGSGYLNDYLTRWPKQHEVWERWLATLENTQRNEQAQGVLLQMEQQFGISSELRLKRVDNLLKQGKTEEAWQLMQATKPLVKPEDHQFWGQYANIAQLAGAEQEMLSAYQQTISFGGDQSRLDNYFLKYLREKGDRRNYENFAIKIWESTKKSTILLDLIDYQVQSHQWQTAKHLLDKLEASDFEKSVYYWSVKAEIATHFNDKPMAEQALRNGIALDPGSGSVRTLLIWNLIAADNKAELRKILSESSSIAQHNISLWEAMAAGYRYLGEVSKAMPWYARALQQWPERYSLILEYAQLMQESGQNDYSKRLVRYFLNKLRKQSFQNVRTSPKEVDSILERRYGEMIRLHLGVEAGERWLKWYERHQNKTDQVFSEYRIAWFLAQQRYESAQAMARQVEASGKTLPEWQQLALATQNNDVATVAKILAKSQKITPLDKVNALRMIGEGPQALDLATSLLNTDQNETTLTPLRHQVMDLKQQYPKGWAIGGRYHNVSELDVVTASAETALAWGKHGLLINYKDLHFDSSKDTLVLSDEQKHEQLFNIEWKYLAPRYGTKLKVGANFRGDSDFGTAEGNVYYQLQPGWRVQLEGAYNTLSSESAVFRIDGLLDKVELRLNGEFSKREYFTMYAQGRHYKTRTGENVGYGYGGGAEVGYRIWFEKPQWVVALYGNWKEANLNSQLPDSWQKLAPQATDMSSILNQSYKEIGLDLRLTEGNLNPFGFTQRSFHYFLETGVFIGQPPGNIGGKIVGGLGMRLFKDDEISLSGQYLSVQGGAQSLPSTAIELRYSKRFD